MDETKELFARNVAWSERIRQETPDFFLQLARQQSPAYLWIGCADSRVPANEIVGLLPGELFVHRNIANVVVHTDLNCLSVMQFAVDILKVRHIIVCGHYGCGGVKTALSRQHLGLINKWLRHIKDVYRLHSAELDAIPDEQKRSERLIELNVTEQVHHLAELSFVQRAWKVHGRPMLHGWIYDIHSGHIKQVKKVDPGQLPHDIYVYEFPELEDGIS
jgi:carbonic anhydrase